LTLVESEREELERSARSRSAVHGLVRQAQIILVRLEVRRTPPSRESSRGRARLRGDAKHGSDRLGGAVKDDVRRAKALAA
jgi:hypothetical protein